MRCTLLAIGLCVLFLTAAPQPGVAFDRATGAGNDAAFELSGAKKKKQRRQYVHMRPAPPAAYVRRPWMDPSFAADGRPYRNPYPPNVCSVDEGYGRFSPCTFRD